MIYFVFQDPKDEDKFYYLYEKYHKLFYKVAYDILHSHQDTEDVIQISLEVIYRYFYKIRDEVEKKCVGYMLMIIKNESIDLFNARKGYWWLKRVYLIKGKIKKKINLVFRRIGI